MPGGKFKQRPITYYSQFKQSPPSLVEVIDGWIIQIFGCQGPKSSLKVKLWIIGIVVFLFFEFYLRLVFKEGPLRRPVHKGRLVAASGEPKASAITELIKNTQLNAQQIQLFAKSFKQQKQNGQFDIQVAKHRVADDNTADSEPVEIDYTNVIITDENISEQDLASEKQGDSDTGDTAKEGPQITNVQSISISNTKLHFNVSLLSDSYIHPLDMSRECHWQGTPLKAIDNGIMTEAQPLFIAGAMKAGTTYLSERLTNHQAFTFMTCAEESVKELHFFDHTALPEDGFEQYDQQWRTSLENTDWYKEHKHKGQIAVDGTPDTMLWPMIAPKIKRLIPNAKMVFILRDPAERALSQYFTLQDLKLQSNQASSIAQYSLTETIYGDLVELTRSGCLFGLEDDVISWVQNSAQFAPFLAEDTQIKDMINNGTYYQDKIVKKDWSQCFKCMQSAAAEGLGGECFPDLVEKASMGKEATGGGFFTRGMYAPQIAHWLKFFDKDSILILQFKDLVGDVSSSLQKITSFLGTDYVFQEKEGDIGYHRNQDLMNLIPQDYLDKMQAEKAVLAKLYVNMNKQLYELLRVAGYGEFEPFSGDNPSVEPATEQ